MALFFDFFDSGDLPWGFPALALDDLALDPPDGACCDDGVCRFGCCGCCCDCCFFDSASIARRFAFTLASASRSRRFSSLFHASISAWPLAAASLFRAISSSIASTSCLNLSYLTPTSAKRTHGFRSDAAAHSAILSRIFFRFSMRSTTGAFSRRSSATRR